MDKADAIRVYKDGYTAGVFAVMALLEGHTQAVEALVAGDIPADFGFVTELELSEKPTWILYWHKIVTITQLLDLSEDDLLSFTNFDQKSLDEVIAKLAERGLSLRKE